MSLFEMPNRLRGLTQRVVRANDRRELAGVNELLHVSRVHSATTLLPTQAVVRQTKALRLALAVLRILVLCWAWVFLVVLGPFPGSSYESVGRGFESRGAHHNLREPGLAGITPGSQGSRSSPKLVPNILFKGKC